MSKPDFSDITHPDPFFHRYLALLERQKAFDRGEKINAFREESAFTELLDRHDVREHIVGVLLEEEKKKIAQERQSLAMDVAKAIGVTTLKATKGYQKQDLARLLCLYEWRKIWQKKPAEPVWGGPFPWREEAGFGE